MTIKQGFNTYISFEYVVDHTEVKAFTWCWPKQTQETLQSILTHNPHIRACHIALWFCGKTHIFKAGHNVLEHKDKRGGPEWTDFLCQAMMVTGFYTTKAIASNLLDQIATAVHNSTLRHLTLDVRQFTPSQVLKFWRALNRTGQRMTFLTLKSSTPNTDNIPVYEKFFPMGFMKISPNLSHSNPKLQHDYNDLKSIYDKYAANRQKRETFFTQHPSLEIPWPELQTAVKSEDLLTPCDPSPVVVLPPECLALIADNMSPSDKARYLSTQRLKTPTSTETDTTAALSTRLD